MLSFLHKRRRRLCGVTLLLLLFAQAAVAAYACPQLDVPGSGRHAEAAHEMADCEGSARTMDPAQPLLCIADCEPYDQAAQPSNGFQILPAILLAVLAPLRLLLPLADATGRIGNDLSAYGRTPPGWPPLHLLNGVWRN